MITVYSECMTSLDRYDSVIKAGEVISRSWGEGKLVYLRTKSPTQNYSCQIGIVIFFKHVRA